MNNEDMISTLADSVRSLELKLAELTAVVGYLPQAQDLTEEDRASIHETATRITPKALPRTNKTALAQQGVAIGQIYGIAHELKEGRPNGK